MSNLTAAAAAALDACNIPTGTTALGPKGDLSFITGMGLVAHASDVGKYTPMSLDQVELRTDHPAWVITTHVKLPSGFTGDTLIDPTCVVIDGQSSWIATGGYVDTDGKSHPGEQKPTPAFTVPSLAP